MEERELEIIQEEVLNQSVLNQSENNSGTKRKPVYLDMAMTDWEAVKAVRKIAAPNFFGALGVGCTFITRVFLKKEFKLELVPPHASFSTFTDETGTEYVRMSYAPAKEGKMYKIRTFLKEEFNEELAPPHAILGTFTDEAGTEYVRMSY